MEKTWIVLMAIALFCIITYLYWKLTNGYAKKLYGKKMYEHWGSRMYYWSSVLLASGAITVMVIYLLKWGNILTF
ncbi:hypothetical protein [Seonamhaeicola maritimus]|uniref:Molybdenum ABC transporter permease n=1 Tax=Seonamhaeicola maritimus TaxID=2591822 RepID=A0A5C7GIC0_9FLAO|nr:hypothetical protein [Seonamhaeicola maritimus]TXG37283.1 hypothetical protein FUA22_12025 [Seonamhaeicola maritimus]